MNVKALIGYAIASTITVIIGLAIYNRLAATQAVGPTLKKVVG